MKRAIGLSLVLMFVATMSYAACGTCDLKKGKKSGGEWVEEKIQKMTDRLGLTDAQATEIRSLLKEKMDKKAAIKKEMRTKMEVVGEEYSAKIRDLLTEEQRQKYDQMKKEHKKGKGRAGDCLKCKKGSHKDKHKDSGKDEREGYDHSKGSHKEDHKGSHSE